MKNKKTVLISLIILTAIVSVLVVNKSRMTVKSSSEIISFVSVSAEKIKKQKISSAWSMVGTITANNDVAIISETQGKVTAVFADVGDLVSAGDKIVQIDDELKKANFLAAETNFEKAKKDLERFELLYKENSATDQQIENARIGFKSAEAQYLMARRGYNDTKIASPIAGIVTARNIDVGNYVSPGMMIANVVDISSLKAKIFVSESDVFGMSAGDRVKVTTDVYPGVEYSGKIRTISSKADEAHTYPVEVTLENTQTHPLKAGMFGRIIFNSRTQDAQLTIPREALVGSVKSPSVYVVYGNIARLRPITIGPETGNNIPVLGGLTEGEIVVTSGQNNLKDSTAVTIID